MKIMKTYLLAALLIMASGLLVRASDESSRNVGLNSSALGVVHTTTGTSRTGETRRLNTDQLGQQLFLDGEKEVILSTGFGAAGLFAVGNTTNAFQVISSSQYLQVGCRGLQDNCNNVRFATRELPVYVDSVFWNSIVIGNPATSPLFGKSRVRIFDTRGSTGTNTTPLNMVFDQAMSSSTKVEVKVWCSSGVTIMKDSIADVSVFLGRQNR
jgi:hypothetical protein